MPTVYRGPPVRTMSDLLGLRPVHRRPPTRKSKKRSPIVEDPIVEDDLALLMEAPETTDDLPHLTATVITAPPPADICIEVPTSFCLLDHPMTTTIDLPDDDLILLPPSDLLF